MPVNQNFGKRKPEAVGRKISQGQKRRAAQGLPVGRTRLAVTYRFKCEVCGVDVEDKHGNTRRVACSQKHGQIIARRNSKKLPDDETIVALYLSGLSGTQISDMYGCKRHHSGVYQSLERMGVKRRRSGPQTVAVCVEKECSDPVYKVWHSQLKGFYGKRCEQHHKERAKNWSKQKYLKLKQQRLSTSR